MPPLALFRLAGTLAAAALLSGCILASDERLVDDGAVPISRGDIVATSYDPDGDGFVRASEEPVVYQYYVFDHSYSAGPDGDLAGYFIPYDGDNRYILALVGSGYYYGMARLRDGLLEVRLELTGDLAAEAAAADRSLPEGIELAPAGLMVPGRAELATMLELIADGTFSTAPHLVWIGDDEAPAGFVPDGDWYAPSG